MEEIKFSEIPLELNKGRKAASPQKGKMRKEHYKQPAEIKMESEMPRRKNDKSKNKVLGFSRVKCLQHHLLLHKAAWHLATKGMPCHGTGLSLPTPTQLPPRDLLITEGQSQGGLLSPQGYQQQQRHYVVHGTSSGDDLFKRTQGLVWEDKGAIMANTNHT